MYHLKLALRIILLFSLGVFAALGVNSLVNPRTVVLNDPCKEVFKREIKHIQIIDQKQKGTTQVFKGVLFVCQKTTYF